MIANLYNEESVASRMLDLIARKAPLFMKVGGGSLGGEGTSNWQPKRPMSAKQKARALELARKGELTVTEIAKVVGATQSAVYKIVSRAGIPTPDGRKPRNVNSRAKDTGAFDSSPLYSKAPASQSA